MLFAAKLADMPGVAYPVSLTLYGQKIIYAVIPHWFFLYFRKTAEFSPILSVIPNQAS